MATRKKQKLEPAALKTIGLFDGMTEEERAARAQKEEQDAQPRGRPLSRRDAAARGRAMAAVPPKNLIPADVKLEPCEDGRFAVVFVGESSGGVISKYACTYVTEAQMDKLCALWQEQRTLKTG